VGVNVEQAKRVQTGDTIVYRNRRHRVLSVSGEGLWAPYFDIDGEGVMSHQLVDVDRPEPAGLSGSVPR
jgi:hypothetical protein